MLKDVITLGIIPGGPFDLFRRTSTNKLPKKADTFLYTMKDVYGSENIINMMEVDIGDYVFNRGIVHALNMNVGRNIPWIEDGLKSGERRALYTMHKDGCYDHHMQKVASITGSMVKDIYPHGENAIADTIYRVGRKKTMMIPYVDNGGNFGGMDTLRPASPRYASACLSQYAMDCFFSEIGAKYPIYDVKDNYQYNGVEPVFLTSRFPNILMQWNLGIGKGVASWLGAFNSRDIFKTAIKFLDDPNAKVEIYPDTPVPIDIINKSELKNCFDRVKFNVRMRAQYKQVIDRRKDQNTGKIEDKYTLVFTSLPISVIGATVRNEIIAIKEKDSSRVNKKLPEVVNVEISTDDKLPGGIEFIVEYEKGYDPEILAEKLFKSTSLGRTVAVSYKLITDNQPCEFTPRQILNIWITQRFDQKRRFYHQKALFAAKERARLEAICTILEKDNTDIAIDIIRKSASKEDAIEALRKRYGFNDFQARMVMQIKLSNLPKMSVQDTKKELADREEEYKHYRKLLSHENYIKDAIREELEYGLNKYSKDRNAVLKNLKTDKLGDPNETKYVFYNNSNYYCLNNLDAIPSIVQNIDKSYHLIKVQNKDTVMIFDKNGMIKTLNGYAFTVSHEDSNSGIDLSTIAFNNVSSILTMNQESDYDQVALVTKDGYGKRMELKECTKSVKGKIINLNPGDELVSVIPIKSVREDSDIIGLVSDDLLYYTKVSTFPQLKRSSAGNRIIKLKTGSAIISDSIYFDMENADYILLYGESGYLKFLDTAYLSFGKRGNDNISLQDKNIIGAICVKGSDNTVKLYDSEGVTNIRINIDKNVQMEIGENDCKRFKLSTTIGSPVKIFKKTKTEFYYLK